MHLVKEAAALRFEWTVMNAGRSASVGRSIECLAALALRVVADDEIAGDEIDFFPMVVHERRGGVGAGRKAQEPRATAHLAALVEIAGENLLLDAGGIAGRCCPAGLHVDAGEFEMRLV